MRAAPMLLPIIPMIVVLAGCSSSFVGQKIGLTPDTQAPIVKTGIPITMNRPEFQLTVKKEKVGNTEQLISTIALNWVPDNAHRYTLSLDPGFFTMSSYKHTFDPCLSG